MAQRATADASSNVGGEGSVGETDPLAGVGSSRDAAKGACSGAGADSVCGGGAGEVRSEATSGWTRRVRIGKAPIERDPNPDRKSALELALRSYAERKEGVVVDPAVGTSRGGI